MLIRLCFLLLCCTALAACNQSKDSTGSDVNPAGDWAKVGETDSYVYYADHASIRKADETVTMSDLFDYKTAQVDGGGPPALSKRTEREYDCQGQKSQPLNRAGSPGRWGPGPAYAPPLAQLNGSGSAGNSHRGAAEGCLWQSLTKGQEVCSDCSA